MRWLALIAVVLVATGCVETGRPDTCDQPTAALSLELSADALTPNNPSVCTGQEVTLVVESTVGGILHVHGYDEQLPATEVTAGERVELDFTAERSGQFPIEFHPDGDPQGVSVGILTVHES